MKTVAQILKHDFSNGDLSLYDSNGNEIYYENSYGTIIDNRPKTSCSGKVIDIDGKKYKLTEI